MIHPSERWQFIQALEDKGYYEEEVVQHHLTATRALRRSFTEKFCSDKIAAEEVRSQMRLAASCRSTALPIVFAVEEVRGCLTIIMELVEGISVRDLMGRQKLAKARDWSEFALTLVDEMLEARHAGARFERIALDQILVFETGEIRLTRRFSIGRVTREQIQNSPFLERLDLLEGGGVYTSEAPPDERAELSTLRDIFVKTASSNLRSSYDHLRGEVLKAPHLHPGKLAGIEASIANLLVRMPPEVAEFPAIETLSALREAILDLRRVAMAPPTMPHTPPPPTHAPAPDPASSGSSPSRTPSSPPRTLYTADLQAAPPDSKSGGAPGSSSRPLLVDNRPSLQASGPKTPPPPTTTAKTAPAISSRNEDDDQNPYTTLSAENAISHAAADPAGKPSEKKNEKSNGSPAAKTATSNSPRKSFPTGLLLKIGIPVILLVGLGMGAVLLMPLMQKSDPGSPPTASIAALDADAYRVNQQVTLDASGSTDPDGDALTYGWTVVAPANASVIFSSTDRSVTTRIFQTRESKVIVQIQSTGMHEFELKVFDGTRYAPPVRIKVNIRSNE